MFYEKLKGFSQDTYFFIYSKSAVFLDMLVVDTLLSATWMWWFLCLRSLKSEFQSLGFWTIIVKNSSDNFCHHLAI